MSRSDAARKAWRTRRSAPYKARKTARASQRAFEAWAKDQGYRVVFLDAPSGNPRTGIVDAVLVRIAPSDADQLELHLVQLKSGDAGLTGVEVRRLKAAAKRIRITVTGACHDGHEIHAFACDSLRVSEKKVRSGPV